MKILYVTIITAIVLCLIPKVNFAQLQPLPPFLGSAESFAVFTAVGSLTNNGATAVTGDVGSNVGGVIGFPPGVLIGSIHDANGTSASAAPDVCNAYGYLFGILGGTTIGINLGNGQALTPNVYTLGAASTLNGSLILDAEGNPDAIFIFQIDGAFATTVGSSVMLINGASSCNLYWQINGAVSLGEGSVFQGTILATGAIHILEAATLSGRALTCAGAIDLHNNIITNGLPIASTITANGATTFCAGGSVTLSGNMGGTWNTGETSELIIVTTSGDFFVTNTDGCGMEISNSITVTVHPLPLCAITGTLSICEGQSTELCATAGAAAYLWSTGETSSCITVSTASPVSVLVTSAEGCTSSCSQTVAVNPLPLCAITGNLSICEGQSTELCAPAGAAAYLWSTGETTSCITVSAAGSVSVLVTSAEGCTSSCSRTVAVNPLPLCAITGNLSICEGQSTELCAPAGAAAYLWSTGETTSCITVSAAGPVSVLVTSAEGCTSSCSQTVAIISADVPPGITCPADITIECNDSTLPAHTGTATAPVSCTLTPVISFADVATPGTCPQELTITRTWTAAYGAGNSVTCTQVITVEDHTPPVITIVNPLLAAPGDTTYVQCYGQDPQWNIPSFNSGSVSAEDDCGGAVTITYDQSLAHEGNCEEDGYIVLYRLTWTATDVCGNSNSAFVFYALIDTIAPVIHGVPADITVNCNDIPALPDLVYATDECLCACVVLVQESTLPTGCLNGQVLLRTWTASDRCGNESVATQRITLIDNQYPVLSVIQPEIAGVPDGTVLTYACSEGGLPDFLNALDEHAVVGKEGCGGATTVSFSLTSIDADAFNCEIYGYLAQRTYQWTVVDACGRTTLLTIVARLIDDEAPVLVGLPTSMTCIDDPALANIYADDACGEAYTEFTEVEIPNPCGTGMVIKRTYEAFDNCGNTTSASVMLVANNLTAPVMEFVDTTMNTHLGGEILTVNCAGSNGHYTAFRASDMVVTDSCSVGAVLSFTERLVSTGDCTVGGIVSVIELKWTATDFCGNTSERIIIAQVVDNSSPVFVDFKPLLTIGCAEVMPIIHATDNCGEVVVTTQDSIVRGDCVFEYVIYREITATDPCGNATTRQQVIQVGDGSGPTIIGVVADICDDLTIPPVTAYDACAGEYVAVTMVQDTLDALCQGGLVIQRTWTAVNSCGYATVIHQHIIMDDQTPPEIYPLASIINYITNVGHHRIFLSEQDLIDQLNLLGEHSVFAVDDCDQLVTLQLKIRIVPGDCEEDGYSERRKYTWFATDQCGNTASYSVSVVIIDDVAPLIEQFIPADTTIVCAELPMAPVIQLDSPDNATVVYSEVIVPGGSLGEFIVTRTWVATDACGNESVGVQQITWIPDTYLTCEILAPPAITCNSHGVLIGSVVTGGFGEYTYEWEVVGENCFIRGGQGTPELGIYVGWSEVRVTLTVTDAFGCVSTCMVVLNCELAQLQIPTTPTTTSERTAADYFLPKVVDAGAYLSNLNVWPNPTTGMVNLSFEADLTHEIQFTLLNFLGQAVRSEQFTGLSGLNTHQLDLGNLAPGPYLMHLKTGQEVQSKTVVVMPKR